MFRKQKFRRDDNITVDRKTGIPSIRNSGVSVQEIVDLLSAGITEDQVLDAHPDLRVRDIRAAQRFEKENLTSPSALQKIIGDLGKSSFWLNIGGYILFIVAITLGILLYLDIRSVTLMHVHEFLMPNTGATEFTESVYPRLIYLIVRSTALGVIATTVIVFCVRTAVACFDQSARFLKRRNGALFLKYLFDDFAHGRLEDHVKMEDIRRFFESWNQNVESAFSHVKVEKKGAGSMEVNVTKEGAMLKSGDDKK
jgi:uncharacterized protein (DUF433 family)